MWMRLLLALTLAGCLAATTLELTILDEHGHPTPARVYLTAPDGSPVLPGNAIVYDKVRPDGQREQHFVPRGGAVTLDIPPGRYRLEVERGKETIPVKDQIDVPAFGRLAKTVRLRRWLDMAARGWYSGDTHMHRPLANVATILESEDLNTAVNITRWRMSRPGIQSDPRLASFLRTTSLSGVRNVSRGRFFTVLNEELEPRNAALLVSRLGRRGSGLNYPMAEYGRRLVDRGALVDSEKATQLELPVHAALGACSLVGLANNHFWRSGFYSGPWGVWPDKLVRPQPQTCTGFALAGFEIYYALLNAGLRLSPSAGSANGVHPVPPGWSRVYVQVPGNLTPQRWFDALESGRSFVTTGPMLLLDVDGRTPGDTLQDSTYPRRVTATIRVLSLEPATEAALVVNGEVRPVALSPANGEPNTWTGTATLELDSTSWVAARWLKPGEVLCSLAHTAPIYFHDGEKPLPKNSAELRYLLSRTEALIHEVETGRNPQGQPTTIITPDDATKAETLRLFQKARDIYRAKLNAPD